MRSYAASLALLVAACGNAAESSSPASSGGHAGTGETAGTGGSSDGGAGGVAGRGGTGGTAGSAGTGGTGGTAGSAGTGGTAALPPSPLVFSAMGDVPYGSAAIATLDAQIQTHNSESDSLFMVHLGDIKTGASACVETVYTSVATQLRALTVPTFIIPGDNEWNDCTDPAQAWIWWTASFMAFDTNWDNAPTVERQVARPENFAWTEEKVLLIGINLVGGRVHDQDEWNARMQHDADWVANHLANAPDDVYAAVVFGHAKPSDKHALFISQFRTAAATFARPVLYIQGDGHTWIHDHPWSEANMLRVQVDAGGGADPVRVTVDPDDPDTFSFERSPFD